MRVSEDMLLDACAREDIAQLQRWGRQGIRVHSGKPLVHTAVWGFVDVARCLVKELGAKVSDRFEGYSPLHVAAQEGHVAVMLCLVKELGANVNQSTQNGNC
jgi:hypothetical protein